MQSMSLHTWHGQGPRKPSSCATFTLNSHWDRSVTGKKSLASMCTGSLRSCPTLCDPVDCGLPGFSVGGFSRQEYWSVLANTGCHILLEHCISCCPRCQLSTCCCQNPCDPSSCTTSTPGPHKGTHPSPPRQPQEQTPVDKPHAEVEIKPQLKPRGSVAKEEDPKHSHQL